MKQNIAEAKSTLRDADAALVEFEERPENNVYASLDEAAGPLEDILGALAFQDCEGAHNCGSPEYTREFMVDGKVYIAKLEVEYNRHDKMYYYVDGTEFSISEKA